MMQPCETEKECDSERRRDAVSGLVLNANPCNDVGGHEERAKYRKRAMGYRNVDFKLLLHPFHMLILYKVVSFCLKERH